MNIITIKTRTFQVRAGQALQDYFPQINNEIPRGSIIILIILFHESINIITKNIDLPVQITFYPDDLIIHGRSKSLKLISLIYIKLY